MTEMRLSDLVKACNGQQLSAIKTDFSGVGTDSRQDLNGLIFFALRGENFDAHDFLAQAADQNAAALVVDNAIDAALCQTLAKRVTIVKVTDTLKALQDFARWWRHQQPAKIVGITGSNGKTTTKQFAATILSEQFRTHAAEGSFNNHWGVPLTLLAIRPEHQVALIEMGMNHSGELTHLCEIADPDVVVVTMVGRAHIEYFGSIEKIAQAKGEIYLAARPAAIRVFNMDDPRTRQMFAENHSKGSALTFSASQSADVCLRLQSHNHGQLQIEGEIAGVAGTSDVPVFGAQNLVNLQAAAAVALAVGARPELIWQGFSKCGSSWGRNQWLQLPSGARILFDAYNANPDSMRALLSNVRDMKGIGKKFAVLGDMLEMGEQSAQLHEELGELAAKADFEAIYFVGREGAAFEAGLRRGGFNKKLMKSVTCEQGLALELSSMLNESDVVIVKGSRGLHLEQVVVEWKPQNFQLKK